MAGEIDKLIEKINQEGIQAAAQKARSIEEDAKRKAEELLERAKREVAQMKLASERQIEQYKEKQDALLKQAGRDMLLDLRCQINKMLQRIIAQEAAQVFDREALVKILGSLIEHTVKHEKSEVVVTLSKEDLHKLEAGFLSKLKDEVKKKVRLVPSEDLRAGFQISYDCGKSQFDFSDKALAEYIFTFLKPKLKEILES